MAIPRTGKGKSKRVPAKTLDLKVEIEKLANIMEFKKQEYIGALGALNYMKSLLVQTPKEGNDGNI